ncbi:MAG: excinuclease ABC subunit UvrC [Vicinamibacterales bacterium]
MAIRELKDQIARLPEQPGVYLYLNAAGETIYVGKARALRDRVRNYLGAYGGNAKTDALLDEVAGLEFIVTDSVVEALALENNLIKQRSPKYNILLRDDKNYPYLQLTMTEAFPRVLVARGVERDGNFYAGPFMPARFARKTMALTHRLFGIRSCNESITGQRPRPCLEYDIKRCIAPCVASICSQDEYGRAVQLTQLFLEGRNDELLKSLRTRMIDASDAERFEEAAQLRDAIRTVQTLHDRQQKMATVDLDNRDVFGVKVGPAGAVVQVFQLRRGRVVERVELGSEAEIVGRGVRDVLAAAVQQFYELRPAAGEVHVPEEPDEREALEAWLSARDGRKVRFVVPQRGDKRALVDLANRNAALAYQSRFNPQATAQYEALETLQAALGLPALPRRIECFDISTFQGSETVASMVVCEDGRMKRGDYRKFRIRGGGGDAAAGRAAAPDRVLDDFASMREVVQRRYRGLLEQGGPFPDLIVIDGGKGQLSAAYTALEALGLSSLVAVALAKKEELVYTRDRETPIALRTDEPALLLLQRIRDEAHRFAVTFHREARKRRDLGSQLDEIPGVGARRRRQLLTRFGSVSGVRRATREELASMVGSKVADAVLAFFSGRP